MFACFHLFRKYFSRRHEFRILKMCRIVLFDRFSSAVFVILSGTRDDLLRIRDFIMVYNIAKPSVAFFLHSSPSILVGRSCCYICQEDSCVRLYVFLNWGCYLVHYFIYFFCTCYFGVGIWCICVQVSREFFSVRLFF